jgi:hypothetical protein
MRWPYQRRRLHRDTARVLLLIAAAVAGLAFLGSRPPGS